MAIAAALSPWVSNGQRLRAQVLSTCARQDFRQTASVPAHRSCEPSRGHDPGRSHRRAQGIPVSRIRLTSCAPNGFGPTDRGDCHGDVKSL